MNDASAQFDRSAEDLGNIVELGHVNVTVPDQRLATIFYISGLGLTRDPYLMSGVDNMWANVGRAQFHLPSRNASMPGQVVRGTTGLVLPDLQALLGRLARVWTQLEGTKFGYRETNNSVEVTCPWGNRIRCHAPDPAQFGTFALGMPAPAGSETVPTRVAKSRWANALSASNSTGRRIRNRADGFMTLTPKKKYSFLNDITTRQKLQ